MPHLRTPPLSLALLLGAGCTPIVCGEGTEEVDGTCVPLLQCGEGTERQGDACASTLSCAEGTELQNGACVPLLSCGEGTHLEGSACVADPPADIDGDGVPFYDDCDDEDPAVGSEQDWIPDADGDGLGDMFAEAEFACQGPAGSVTDATDCDDTNADVYPGAPETCDGEDNDCDGDVEERDCPSGVLPETGQTTCFDATSAVTCPSSSEAFYGQDASYAGRPMELTDRGDGTVHDGVTGLVWQKDANAAGLSWWDAATYCQDLSLGGASDWRIPNRYEAMTILDFGREAPAAPDVLTTGANAEFWVSDEESSGGARGIYIWWRDGQEGVNPKGNFYNVRCVRGAMPEQAWESRTDGTITESSSERMWTMDDGASRNWEEALAYCHQLRHGGFEDWHLPDMKELRSTTRSGMFPSLVYWSSTTRLSEPYRAYITTLYFRGTSSQDKATSYWRTLCVRDTSRDP